jgi:hypothetical protein
MTPIDYHCKICGKPGVAYYNPECPIKDLNLWRDQICCDRCYTFRDAFSRCREAAGKLCYLLTVFRAKSNTADGKKALSDVEPVIRQKLTPITQKIARICCNYHKVTNVWDVDFVNQLMEKPNASNRTIDAYSSGIRKIATTPARQPHAD